MRISKTSVPLIPLKDFGSSPFLEYGIFVEAPGEDLAALDALIRLCLPIVDYLVRFRYAAVGETSDELYSLALVYLNKILPRYDPVRGGSLPS